MMSTGSPSWHCVVTHRSAEWQAYVGLLRNGVHAFYPYFLDSARHGRWRQGMAHAQFPGYIFALAKPKTYALVRAVPGVRDLLRTGIEFVSLNNRQMQVIRNQCADRLDRSFPVPDSPAAYVPGMLCQVPAGDLQGLPVIVETVDRSGRIVASLGALKVSFSAYTMCTQNSSARPNEPSTAAIRTG